jgi:adenine/guanine phosphoribosyltransferase-like PRPP-binding protein
MKYSAKYRGSIDAILSPAADGIPYATLLAEYSGVPLVIAKNSKEVGVDRFVEGSVMTEDGRLLPYYFARFLIRKNYRVLIVDDVIRTGRTHQCLIDMIKKIRAYPIAIHVIIAIGSSWRNRIKEVPVEPITLVS